MPSGIPLVNDFVTGGVDKALTAEAGKNLYEMVFGEPTIFTKDDATVYPVYNGEDSQSPNRLRVVIPVNVGDLVAASCNLGKGVAASVYDTVEKCKRADVNYLQTLSYSFVDSITGTITSAGYLCVSLAKTGDAVFSSAEQAEFFAALSLTVSRGENGVLEQIQEYVDEQIEEINEDFDELRDDVFGETQYEEYTKANATVYKVYRGQSVQSNFNRIRVVIELKAGDTMSASCSLGKGVAASVYASLEDALAAGTNYLQTISYTYEASLTGTLEVDGLLTVTLAKSDDSQFSDAEYTQYLNALTLTGLRKTRDGGAIALIQEEINGLGDEINELRGEIADIDSNKVQDMFLGKLVQKSLTASGLSNTNKDYRVSMASCIVVPREGVKLSFVLPDGYGIGLRSGERAENLSNNNYWYLNGTTFTFASNVRYFRLCFAKCADAVSVPTETITLAEVETLISSGAIRVLVAAEEDIVQRNRENEKYIKAVMRNWVTGITNNYSLTKLPVFAHISDVHGDATRFKGFMDYCDFLKVDAALVSGDTVAFDPSQSMQYINDVADEHSTMALVCMGNHDARNLTTAQAQNETILGYLITKNSCTTNPNETYPTYYYKDFASKSIRVISINLYESSHSSDNANFTQAQCTWLISVLASTPANYGVLIMFHSPEARPSKDNSHAVFYQDMLNWTGYQANLTGNVFRKIVDAFIGRTSTSITYKVGSTNITVSADFTGVASGVEFIAYVNGHLHADLIGYTPDATYLQLNLNVNCGVAVYGDSYQGLANLSDLPRGCVGATQDCFNVYAIDRAAKTVRIAKVGSNVTGTLLERKYMEIPYAV